MTDSTAQPDPMPLTTPPRSLVTGSYPSSSSRTPSRVPTTATGAASGRSTLALLTTRRRKNQEKKGKERRIVG